MVYLSYPIEKEGMNPEKKKWRREIKMGGGGERRKREGRIEALRNVGLQRIDITS